MNEIRFDLTDLDESPPTIAYVLLALSTLAFNYSLVVTDEYDGDLITATDEDSGLQYYSLKVSHMMGRFLVAVLEQTARELSGAGDGSEEPWTSKQ